MQYKEPNGKKCQQLNTNCLTDTEQHQLTIHITSVHSNVCQQKCEIMH